MQNRAYYNISEEYNEISLILLKQPIKNKTVKQTVIEKKEGF